MSNPTSNFGWQMPTNTDLVSQLPADFEVFGQAVDTSLADLKGGTTGQVLAKATNTDMDFTWVTNAGDIEGVTAGVGITGGGTSGTVTITNSMATAIDAKGDLVAGTGADAFSRLAVGSNGTVLTADSAEATGLKWGAAPASGWTLISSVTPSTSSTNVSFTGISSSYRDLRVMFSARPSGSGNIQITTNGATEYSWNLVTYSNTWTGGTRFGYFQITPTTDLVTDNAKYDITFYDSNSTTKYKSGLWTGSYRTTALGSTIALFGTFATDSSTAISSITISSTGGNWAAGGTVALYGLA